MEKRLQQFLSAENITQSQFAESINVTKASISHILAGRNKPGFDFIENLAKKYPNLNLEWLILGKGKMYKGQKVSEKSLSSNSDDNSGVIIDSQEDSLFSESSEHLESQDETPPNLRKTNPKPKITKVLVFYDDGTFKELV